MFKKNKKGVFGLTAVQSFFAIILGVALLAYIIVIIMGVLGGTTILPVANYAATNESNARPTTAGITLSCAGRTRCTCGNVTSILNGTSGTNALLVTSNFVQSDCLITNNTDLATNMTATMRFTYTYSASSTFQDQQDNILGNTSTGVTGFFSSINPIYAILAVLVIILVLVVLVRVVQGGSSSGRQEQL